MLLPIRSLYRYLAGTISFLYPLATKLFIVYAYWHQKMFVVYAYWHQKYTGIVLITLPRAVKRETANKPVFSIGFVLFSNSFSLRRSEWNYPVYHQVSGYFNIKSILFLYKYKTSKTPFWRDLNLYFGIIGGAEVNIVHSPAI